MNMKSFAQNLEIGMLIFLYGYERDVKVTKFFFNKEMRWRGYREVFKREYQNSN